MNSVNPPRLLRVHPSQEGIFSDPPRPLRVHPSQEGIFSDPPRPLRVHHSQEGIFSNAMQVGNSEFPSQEGIFSNSMQVGNGDFPSLEGYLRRRGVGQLETFRSWGRNSIYHLLVLLSAFRKR